MNFIGSMSWFQQIKLQTTLLLFDNVCWLHYIDTLKQELSGTKAYEQTSEKEKSVINNHIFHNATRSHSRHLVGKRTAQKDTIIDITSDSQVNSNFPYRWSPASLTFNNYFYLFLYLNIT